MALKNIDLQRRLRTVQQAVQAPVHKFSAGLLGPASCRSDFHPKILRWCPAVSVVSRNMVPKPQIENTRSEKHEEYGNAREFSLPVFFDQRMR